MSEKAEARPKQSFTRGGLKFDHSIIRRLVKREDYPQQPKGSAEQNARDIHFKGNKLPENLMEEEKIISQYGKNGENLLNIYKDILQGHEINSLMNKVLKKTFNNNFVGVQSYVTECDFHIGDLIIQFPNPDHKFYQDSKKFKPIKNTKVDKIFKKCVKMIDAKNNNEIMDYEILKAAFLSAFNTLENSYNRTTKRHIQYLRRVIQQEEAKQSNQANKNYLREEEEASMDNPRVLLDKLLHPRNFKKVHTGGQQLKLVSYLPNQLLEKKDILNQRLNKLKEMSDSDPEDDQLTQIQIKQQYLSSQKRGGKSPKGAKNKMLSLFQNTKYAIQKFKQNLKTGASNLKRKSAWFLKNFHKNAHLPHTAGGENRKGTQKARKVWIQHNTETRDFMTLMRNLILLRLQRVGFKMRHFLSVDGKFIYTVLQADDENLQITAENDGIRKALMLEMFDLFSFEPVDELLRPLRLNMGIWDQMLSRQNQELPEDEDEEKDRNWYSDIFRYLSKFLQALISDVDFKRIARETNQSQINNQLFNYKEKLIIDQAQCNDQIWQAFYEYIIYVNENLRKLRSTFNFSNGEALAINKMVEREGYFKFNRKPHNTKSLQINKEGNYPINQIEESEEENSSDSDQELEQLLQAETGKDKPLSSTNAI